jgi:hypothetical protein
VRALPPAGCARVRCVFAEQVVIPQHNYRLDLKHEVKHEGEKDWRHYRDSILDILPHVRTTAELFCIPSGRCSRLLCRLSFPYRRTGSTLTRSPSHYAPPMGAVLGRVAVLEYARGHDAASPPLRQARSPKQPLLKGGALNARRCLIGAHRRVGAPHRWLPGFCRARLCADRPGCACAREGMECVQAHAHAHLETQVGLSVHAAAATAGKERSFVDIHAAHGDSSIH